MNINERIKSHEIERRKLNDKKDVLEQKLDVINDKIIFHSLAIYNLHNKTKVINND